VQSSVHCARTQPSARSRCVPAVGQSTPRCADVDPQLCGCEANTSSLPALAYQRQMLREAVESCRAHAALGQKQFRALVIGLGGGAMPMYLRRHCSAAHLESVEVDARVAEIAERLLGFERDSRSELEVADGLASVERRVKAVAEGRSQPYSLVLVDCFAGGRIPEACSSGAFARGLRGLLSPEGFVLQNAGRADESALLSAYRIVFGDGRTNITDVAESTGQLILRAAARS